MSKNHGAQRIRVRTHSRYQNGESTLFAYISLALLNSNMTSLAEMQIFKITY